MSDIKRPDGVYVKYEMHKTFDDYQHDGKQEVTMSRARLQALMNDDWHYIGVRAAATITVIQAGYETSYELLSPGLWGVESDADEGRLKEIFEDECEILRNDLALIGAHFKPSDHEYVIVEHSGMVDECQCDRFASLDEAYAAMKRDYCDDDIAEWKVKIAVDRGDGILMYDY